MHSFVLLGTAILLEIFSTSMLKMSLGFTKLVPSLLFITGMGLSFYALSNALLHIPLNTAYAIWSGLGTALTAFIGVLVWKEHLDIYGFAGIILIIAGVVLLNLKANVH